MIKTIKNLEVYTISYTLAVEVFGLSKAFPKEELYSLTDQIRRSSRSVTANISEGFAKRIQPNIFRNHLLIASGSLAETLTWLEFAKEFKYLSENEVRILSIKYDELGGKIYNLYRNWKSH